MAEDKGKEEEKFDFTAEGEGYISLAEARVLAVRTAVETPGDYGRQYQGVTMVFEAVESGEDEDFYNITLSFRPQGNFAGTPGQEQFVVGKEGTIAVRQVLSFPTQTSGSGSGGGRAGGIPSWLLFGGVGATAIAVIAVVAFIALRPSPTTGVGGGPGTVQVAIPADTPEPTDMPEPTVGIVKTIEAGGQQGRAKATPMPTYTPQPTYTPYPTPTSLPRPTPTSIPRPTAQAATRVPADARNGGQYGGTVRMSAYADIRDWDPRGSSHLSSIQAVSQLYNQLVQMDTTDTSLIVCDLCDSWEISNGGETFTFKIRDGIKWIDGTDLTADDIHNSMLRYGDLDGPTGRSGLWRNYTLEAKNGGVNLIDDKTIEFNLQFASGAFIKFLALDYVKVLPKKALDVGLDLNLAETIINYKLGSGPFVLDEYQRGNFYKVSKNDNYFKEGRPFFDGIDHFIITDTGTLLAQFKAGQIDMSNGGFTNLAPTQAFELEKYTGGNYRPVAVSPSADWGLMMNVKKAPFNDARVREAIQLAIDYQQWNDLVFDNTSGVGCPLMGMAHTFEECNTWPGLRPKDGPGGADDIARAKALMAEAGYPDGFKTRYDVRQVGTYPDQCTVVQYQLRQTLGIDGEITTYPSAAGYAFFGTSRAAYSEGDWELACQGEGQVVLDVDGIMGGVYLKGATRNYTDWSNDKVDAWFDAQKQEPDRAKRREINKNLENFLFSQQDNHWITLGWGILQWIIGPDIRGFNAPQTVQTHFKHEDLWLDR